MGSANEMKLPVEWRGSARLRAVPGMLVLSRVTEPQPTGRVY